MVVGESREREALEEEVAPVAAFFTPFFFGFIGAQIDVAAILSPAVLCLLAVVSGVAIITKFAGAFIGAVRLGSARATLVAWGMVPRGEVGIVVAGLGLSTGAIGAELYSVVVGMAVVTTLIVPPLLGPLARRAEVT
jgi:Kef-type K+ transport system membrane component KefB